jgi:pyroglutamyl-peptidase
MTRTILLTGFGPFPGAPFNPTGLLVTQLARRRHPAFAGVRRVAHVFRTTYEAVDRELPALLAQERPIALVMFGLAQRSRHIRIETLARNTLTHLVPDASGRLPLSTVIAPGAPEALQLRTPSQKLVMAAKSAGMPAALSRDAGSYLCNYLCWRAGEAATASPPLRVAAFVHVPRVHRTALLRSGSRGPPFTFDALVRAGEAIVLAALAAARR